MIISLRRSSDAVLGVRGASVDQAAQTPPGDVAGDRSASPASLGFHGVRQSMGRVGQGQRRSTPTELTLDAQRLPAGGQHGHLCTATQQLRDHAGARVDEVLAIVEDDEQFPAAYLRHQRVDGSLTRGQLQPQRLGPASTIAAPSISAARLDQKGTVAIPLAMPAGKLNCERRLAATTRTGQGQQARAGEHLCSLIEFPATAHHRGHARRQVRGARPALRLGRTALLLLASRSR